MKKILITGINGFVGPHLVAELQKQGYSIYGLSRTGKSELKNDVVILKGDLLQLKELYLTINELKPDAIFHLAAQSKPGYSFKEPQETFQSNIIGTTNLFEVVRGMMNDDPSYRPRIIAAGTSEEYGLVTESDLPLIETSKFNPVNPYAISKVAQYYLSMMYIRAFKLDIVYAVLFSHVGPGQKEGFIIPDVCKQIVEIENGKKDPILTTGDLSVSRDYSDVRDFARAYILLLEKGKTGERYNICSGKPTQVSEIVDSLISMSHVKIEHKIDQSKIRPTEMPILYGSCKKFAELTGWKTEISLDKTLEDCLEWWRNN
jgi:GDP-4-dehydro-6-deoxy-D-mannose reductase